MAHYVKIHYGPYESFYTLSHKPQKLRGISDRLRKLGYRVDLIPEEYVNYCVFEMMGHEVFRCNIQNLQFNTEVQLDPVSQRAVDACIVASSKLERARNHFWFWSLVEDSVMRTDYAPKDHWPVEVELKKYADCLQCRDCCGILTRSKIAESNEKRVVAQQSRLGEKIRMFDYEKNENEFLNALSIVEHDNNAVLVKLGKN